jgi:hypothetical protein
MRDWQYADRTAAPARVGRGPREDSIVASWYCLWFVVGEADKGMQTYTSTRHSQSVRSLMKMTGAIASVELGTVSVLAFLFLPGWWRASGSWSCWASGGLGAYHELVSRWTRRS